MYDKEEQNTPRDEETLIEQEAAYERFVWDNLRRNYIGHYLHGMLGMTGFRLMNAPTFLPTYLHMLSGSDAVVGLGLALQQLGGVVSPIIGAAHLEHRKKVLPISVWLGTGMRIPILLMAATGWFMSGMSGEALLFITIGLLFIMGLFGGAQQVAFQLLLAKVIPISRRGRLQAWRNVTGGLIAAVLSWAAGAYLIEKFDGTKGYALTFALAFVLTSLGLTALRLAMREPEPPTVRPRTRIAQRLKDFPELVKSDRDYMFFLIAQTCAMAARVAAPFYILYAFQTIPQNGANLGILSLAFLGADTATNLAWGYAGDKFGFRATFITSLGLWIGATVLLLTAHDLIAVVIAFFALGAAQSGYMMSSGTLVLEFGNRDDMAMRLALSSTVNAVMSTAGPLVGGLVAMSLGYPPLLVASAVFLGGGLLILLFKVKEPRTRRT